MWIKQYLKLVKSKFFLCSGLLLNGKNDLTYPPATKCSSAFRKFSAHLPYYCIVISCSVSYLSPPFRGVQLYIRNYPPLLGERKI